MQKYHFNLVCKSYWWLNKLCCSWSCTLSM